MTTLHLGVVDTAYTAGGKTTGDVAEILESKYRIMGNFYDAHQNDIAVALEASIGDALDNLLMGAPPGDNATAAVAGDIETLFHRFISDAEMETGEFVSGVPTKAALRGVNHRLAHPYAKGNPRRPSFRDTGLYEASFKAWID